MPLREVLQFPDKRLARVSQPVEAVTDEIRRLAADMLDVMYDEPGIGLEWDERAVTANSVSL